MARIIIRNFLEIKSGEIEFAPFTILIGPQASGKSITAKLLYFFETVKNEFWQPVRYDMTMHNFRVHVRSRFDSLFPKYSRRNQSCKIEYVDGDFSMTIDYSTKNVFNIHSETQKEHRKRKKSFINSIEKMRNEDGSIDVTRAIHAFSINKNAGDSDEYKEYIGNKFMNIFVGGSRVEDVLIGERPLYVPATRSLLSILEKNVFSIFNMIKTDVVLSEFGKEYDSIKYAYSILKKSKKNEIVSAMKMAKVILKGEFDKDSDDEYIKKDGQRVELFNTSSGQQCVTPLLLAILKPLIDEGIFPPSYFIEEPEAHLFPVSQYEVVKLISYIRNAKSSHSKYFITTHSPYVVSSVNNLIEAGRANLSSDGVDGYFKSIAINSKDVGAYTITDGVISSIIDSETGLIDADAIDSASEVISSDFDYFMEKSNASI